MARGPALRKPAAARKPDGSDGSSSNDVMPGRAAAEFSSSRCTTPHNSAKSDAASGFSRRGRKIARRPNLTPNGSERAPRGMLVRRQCRRGAVERAEDFAKLIGEAARDRRHRFARFRFRVGRAPEARAAARDVRRSIRERTGRAVPANARGFRCADVRRPGARHVGSSACGPGTSFPTTAPSHQSCPCSLRWMAFESASASLRARATNSPSSPLTAAARSVRPWTPSASGSASKRKPASLPTNSPPMDTAPELSSTRSSASSSRRRRMRTAVRRSMKRCVSRSCSASDRRSSMARVWSCQCAGSSSQPGRCAA